MDPVAAAQPNTNNNPPPARSSILPGQFVQIGEEPQIVPSQNLNVPASPAAQFKMPDSSAPAGIVSSNPAPIPAPINFPKIDPLLDKLSPTAKVGSVSSQPPSLPPLDQSLEKSQLPSIPAPIARPSSQQPDPTPFVVPGQVAAIQQHIQPPEPAKHSKGKVVFYSIGAIFLVGIVAGLAYFFVFNKNLPLGAKVEDTIKSQLEDLPPLPKRITGGFADLVPIQAFFAQAAPPSAAPNVNVPAY